MTELKDTIKQFIIDNFLFDEDEELDDDASFFDEGIIDSTGMLEIISFLEENFSIQIDDEELTRENLDSINNLVAFLSTKKIIQQAQ